MVAAVMLLAVVWMAGCPQEDAGREQAPSAPETQVQRGPRVVIKGGRVYAGDAPQDFIRVIEQEGRIDKLSAHLKQRRDAWKDHHPNKPFLGEVALVIEQEVSAPVFEAVFRAIAYSGFAYPSVKTAGGYVMVHPQYPPLGEHHAYTPVTRSKIHLYLDERTVKLVEKHGAKVMHERTLERADKPIAPLVKELLSGHFLRHEVSPSPPPKVILHLHERLQSPAICALIEGADAAHRRLAKPGRDEVNGPYRQRVFELELSML